MSRPRVLVVDDDASVRRFVALALEDLAIDLCVVDSVAAALALLRADGPADLVLTDLMMPGESGFDLLQALADAPSLRGAATLAVLSAGLDAATRGRLEVLGVTQALRKPISVGELEACVRAAVGLAAAAVTAAAVGGGAGSGLDAAALQAVQCHFGGDAALFLAFREACREQFTHDLGAGRLAVDRADAAALRLLAHSLKSVFATLGQDELARVARDLELGAAAADWPAALPLWDRLQAGLAAQSVKN